MSVQLLHSVCQVYLQHVLALRHPDRARQRWRRPARSKRALGRALSALHVGIELQLVVLVVRT